MHALFSPSLSLLSCLACPVWGYEGFLSLNNYISVLTQAPATFSAKHVPSPGIYVSYPTTVTISSISSIIVIIISTNISAPIARDINNSTLKKTMPSLTLPLLSSSPTTDISSPTPKKTPKKLRRKNPPPTLTTAHQKLPSSAGSSTYSRPSSSKSNPPDNNSSHQVWTASLPTPHPGKREGEPRASDWSSPTGDFPLGPPPPIPATLRSGLMTPPPESDPTPEVLLGRQGQQIQNQIQNQGQNPGVSPRSVSSVYSSPPTSSNQEHFPANVQQQQQPYVAHSSPPPQIIRGKGRDAFKAFSYDSYNSSSAPPPTSTSSLPQTYLSTAQHPKNLLLSVSPPPNTINMHTRSKTLPSNLDLTDLAPPPRIIGRAPDGSPILPPLPSFQSGGFGFDLPGITVAAPANTNKDNAVQPKVSPTYPGRQKYRPTSLPSPTAPPVPDRKRPSMYFQPELALLAPAPAEEASQGEYICHALTAEEPITLPSSAEHTPEPSPPTTNAEFEQQPPAKGRARRKSDAVSSFLGGWKLTMMGGGNSSSTARNEKALGSGSESDVSPVGVGDGGGWIHRRKGSFSSTRPPSRERSKHGAYAQEYKEFRAQKAAGNVAASSSATSSKRSSQTTSREGSVAPAPHAPASPVEGTGVSGILGGMSMTTRERSAEKAKGVEGRKTKRESGGYASDNSPPPVPMVDPSKIASASEVVSLDVAVRQMQLLEKQLKKGRPLSPPDSRDGEKSESDRGYQASSEYSQTTTAASSSRQGSADSSQQNSGTSSPSGSINQKFQVLPAPQPSSSKQQQISESTGKGKSRSPLRNEIDSESVSGDEKKEPERPKSMGKHSSSSSTVRQQQDYFSRPKSSGAALESGSAGSAGSRPPTPPKPIAKLFVICCRCKYWHDLPSVMYRGMVENGGATRCPYCLHGMEVSCCAGYTCVVYMHQKHH